MPVLLLWAVPAVIVVGGAGYWLIHMHCEAEAAAGSEPEGVRLPARGVAPQRQAAPGLLRLRDRFVDWQT